MNNVARIDEAKTGFPGHWSPNRRVADLRLRVIDSRLVALDLSIELIDRGLLGIKLLACREFLFVKGGISLQIDLRVLQIRFVLRLFRERLVESRLIGPRINLLRLHGAESVKIHREIGRLSLRDGDRDGDGRLSALGVTPGCPLYAILVEVTPASIAGNHDNCQDSRDYPSAT
jgi:hypothetical protein